MERVYIVVRSDRWKSIQEMSAASDDSIPHKNCTCNFFVNTSFVCDQIVACQAHGGGCGECAIMPVLVTIHDYKLFWRDNGSRAQRQSLQKGGELWLKPRNVVSRKASRSFTNVGNSVYCWRKLLWNKCWVNRWKIFSLYIIKWGHAVA
jgi:hypothetical protein